MKTKTYVITGAASGIGKVLCERLSKDNIVFAGYRTSNNIQGENIYPFYVDYSKPETIAAAAEYIKSKCSKIDTLVNVAGCVVAGPVEKISIDEIRRQFEVNVFGHLDLSQRLIDYLDEGKIINVSSMASYAIFPFVSPYCASKRCLDILFNSLLMESKRDIKVISVKPGVISTPLWGKSVKENSKYIENCVGYEKEMEFLIANAQKNEEKGLSAQMVADVIIKADLARNPKLSYTIGRDAMFARWFSKLPQGIVNRCVRLGIKLRINKNK